MIDQKLRDIWPVALGTLYIGQAPNVSAPYSVAHLISGQPFGRIKNHPQTDQGRYRYQIDVYTTSAAKNAVIAAVAALAPSDFVIVSIDYKATHNDQTNLHRHIFDMICRDRP